MKQARPFGLFEKIPLRQPRRWATPTSSTRSARKRRWARSPPPSLVRRGDPEAAPQARAVDKKYTEWAKSRGNVKDPQPKLGASWGYASVYIIAEAIKRAKSADQER